MFCNVPRPCCSSDGLIGDTVVHNHPSGDPTPSPEDVEATRHIYAAGEMIDVELLDHLVIGQQRFISLRERGLGFS